MTAGFLNIKPKRLWLQLIIRRKKNISLARQCYWAKESFT